MFHKKTINTYLYTYKDILIYHDNDNEDSAHEIIAAGFGDGFNYIPYKKLKNRLGSIQWYRCIHSVECPKVQLKRNTITNTYSIVRNEEDHYHSETLVPGTSLRYGIDEGTKELIQEYERLSLKPATMLRSLRDKTNRIPTVQQLNNFLKSLRNKRDDIGVTGSRMCLNDFLYLQKEFGDIPENPDSMFVSDCFCEATTVNGEMIRTFRIFFTTKRLLSFTM